MNRNVLIPLLMLSLYGGGASLVSAQSPVTGSQAPPPAPAQTTAPTAVAQTPAESKPSQEELRRQRAEEQLKQEERQRILGVIPEFNTTNIPDAEPLTVKQKFELALKSTLDPAVFVFSAADAGFSQLNDSYKGYGQGAEGYFKRFGASYLDGFDGTMWGNAILPALWHQDPRYFRKGTGTFSGRLWYAVLSTFRCKTDAGNWAPNYSNVVGNFVAGGISNLYYPSTDRGAALTVERAATV
ncbi:MAG: hypothetical protein JO061_08420, partial [Acidobacteriaceae bacterium]|nr:hypothetical protein [Acidobacteriaceae bacterium]